MRNPMESFESGYNVASKGRKPLQGVLDAFDEEKSMGRKFKYESAIERIKNEPTEKDMAQTNLANAQTDWMKGMSDMPVDDENGLVLDSVGRSGPRFVNQKARLQVKQAESQMKDLPKLDRAFGAVQQLKNQYQSAVNPVSIKRGSNPLMGAVQKGMQGMGQKAMSIGGANPELNRYLANREGFASLISKGGFMEAGVLTNEDIKRITSILPSEYSTREESDMAWSEIEKILQSARDRFEQTESSMFGGSRADSAPDASTTSNAPDVESIKDRLRKRYMTGA